MTGPTQAHPDAQLNTTVGILSQEVAGRIAALADHALKGPARAYTERQTTYAAFCNGQMVSPLEDRPPPSPDLYALLDATIEAVTKYVETIPRPRQIIWRTGPEIEIHATDGTYSVYLRLAVESLEAEAAAPEPAPPEPISLAEARAVKANDSQLWSPADALRHALRQIENGEINPTSLMIDWFEGEPDGGFRHCYTLSGLTVQGRIAMLQAALTRAVNEWFR